MTAIFGFLALNGPPEIFREPIESLAWTERGSLVAITTNRACDVFTGRSRPLVRFTGTVDDPIHRESGRLRLNVSRNRAVGRGFVVDLRTLRSTSLKRAATWQGDRLVEIVSPSPGRYQTLDHGRRTSLAPGWYVLGLSSDLRWALASAEEPFDGDSTSILRLEPRTGHATIVATYPASSDDHNALGEIEGPSVGGEFLVHSDNLAGDLTTPFFAGRTLRPFGPKAPTPLMTVENHAERVGHSSAWLLIRRRVMRDGAHGFDSTLLDLWNGKTGRTMRVAKAVDDWTTQDGRGSGLSIGAYALDPVRHRVAYVVASPKEWKIVVRSIPIP